MVGTLFLLLLFAGYLHFSTASQTDDPATANQNDQGAKGGPDAADTNVHHAAANSDAADASDHPAIAVRAHRNTPSISLIRLGLALVVANMYWFGINP